MDKGSKVLVSDQTNRGHIYPFQSSYRDFKSYFLRVRGVKDCPEVVYDHLNEHSFSLYWKYMFEFLKKLVFYNKSYGPYFIMSVLLSIFLIL